jgi:hypothetical protein
MDHPTEMGHPQSSEIKNPPTNSPSPNVEERKVITVMPEIENPQKTPTNDPIIGQIPAKIMQDILMDLTNRTDANKQDIQVIRAQAVTWNDGSLGCPEPGVFYTQALVDGYWVVLQIAGGTYDYRVSDSGFFRLCENAGKFPVTPPAEISPKE